MANLLEAAAPKSDQLNACDFLVSPRTFTIRDVVVKKDGEQKVSVFFEGCPLPWKPCKSMIRVMMVVWGSTNGQDFIGKRLTLFNDEKVMWGGVAVGGIRISHMSGLQSEKSIALRATKQASKVYIVKPLIESHANANESRVEPQPDAPQSHQAENIKSIGQQFADEAAILKDKATKCLERNDMDVLKVLVMDWYRLCYKYTTEHEGFVVNQKGAEGMHDLLMLEKPISIQKGYIDFGGDNIVHLDGVIAMKMPDNNAEGEANKV